jgi:dethiobiotin synthetase
MRGVLVTGTDTGVGKTVVAVALLRSLTAQGLRCVGMKPVAAGFDDDGAHADVKALAAAGNVDAPLDDRNPYRFAAAVAPHLAAEAAGTAIDVATIAAAATRLCSRADAVVVEGAGGVLVPLGARHDVLDIALALDLPVVLVVGLRLGCINHALLSAMAIRRRGLVLQGWIANRLPPAMALADENVRTLAARIGNPAAVSESGAPALLGADVLRGLGLPGGLERRSC